MMRDAYTEKRALEYIDTYGPPNNPKPEYLARMKYVASFISTGSVLDVGCGEGHLYSQIKRKEYIGIDSSPHMIAKAKEYFPGGDFRIIDAFKLGELKANTVVSTSLLIHIEFTLLSGVLQSFWEHTTGNLIFTIPISVDVTSITSQNDPDNKLLITNISLTTFNKLMSDLSPKPKAVKCILFPPGAFGHGLNDYLIKLTRTT